MHACCSFYHVSYYTIQDTIHDSKNRSSDTRSYPDLITMIQVSSNLSFHLFKYLNNRYINPTRHIFLYDMDERCNSVNARLLP